MGRNKGLHFLFLIVTLLMILLIIFPKPTTLADEEKPLFIVIHDNETNLPIQEDIFYEGKRYDIAIGCEGEFGYVYNVSVNIPWENTYLTSEELPWITVKTPVYEQYSEFVISASKNGYVSVEQKIGVLKGELSLSTDRGTVKEKGSFTVTVFDQNSNKLEGCMVFIDGFEVDSDITGSNGIAYVTAPEVDENTEIDINAFKPGYLAGKTTIRIESLAPELIPDSWYPILGSLIIVFLAILIVRLRKSSPRNKQKVRSKPTFEKNIQKTKKMKHERNFQTKNVRATKDINNQIPIKKGPWVEEIRIRRPELKKETRVVTESKKVASNTKKNDCDWFKGKKYMKYKIDELTGEIDKQGDGKWFEGIDDIKLKVDRRLKENGKKVKQGE